MRILIADDDALIAQSLQQVLQALGFETDMAAHPAAALAAQRSRPADVVLVDWNMPGGGGRGLISALVAGEAPPVQVILVTGMPALSLPPDVRGIPVLQKPFRVQQLLSLLESQVAASGGEEGGHDA